MRYRLSLIDRSLLFSFCSCYGSEHIPASRLPPGCCRTFNRTAVCRYSSVPLPLFMLFVVMYLQPKLLKPASWQQCRMISLRAFTTASKSWVVPALFLDAVKALPLMTSKRCAHQCSRCVLRFTNVYLALSSPSGRRRR